MYPNSKGNNKHIFIHLTEVYYTSSKQKNGQNLVKKFIIELCTLK